jgi:hypothetical protein
MMCQSATEIMIVALRRHAEVFGSQLEEDLLQQHVGLVRSSLHLAVSSQLSGSATTGSRLNQDEASQKNPIPQFVRQ